MKICSIVQCSAELAFTRSIWIKPFRFLLQSSRVAMIVALCYLVCATSTNLLAAKRVTTSTVTRIEEKEISMVDLSGLLKSSYLHLEVDG